MALTSEEELRLAKLQAAYDKLISGQAVAEVQSDGETLKYTAGNFAHLKAAIDALNAKKASSTGRTRGAIRFRIP